MSPVWHLLRTRRWLSFTATALLAIIAFGFLSRWQWHRAHEEDAKANEVQSATSAVPVDLSSLDPTASLPPDQEYLAASATGQLDCDRGYLVRNRPSDSGNGFWVACPLQTADGAWVWVNRGWLAADGPAIATVAMPAGPLSTVVVTGHLRSSQTGPDPQPTDLPAGQVTDLDTAVLSGLAGLAGPVYEPYLDATSMSPADPAQLQALPLPTKDSAQNYSYAGQWLLFAAVAIGGWVFFLRREAQDLALEQTGDRVDQPTR